MGHQPYFQFCVNPKTHVSINESGPIYILVSRSRFAHFESFGKADFGLEFLWKTLISMICIERFKMI
jgi:hypothetical protein